MDPFGVSLGQWAAPFNFLLTQKMNAPRATRHHNTRDMVSFGSDDGPFAAAMRPFIEVHAALYEPHFWRHSLIALIANHREVPADSWYKIARWIWPGTPDMHNLKKKLSRTGLTRGTLCGFECDGARVSFTEDGGLALRVLAAGSGAEYKIKLPGESGRTVMFAATLDGICVGDALAIVANILRVFMQAPLMWFAVGKYAAKLHMKHDFRAVEAVRGRIEKTIREAVPQYSEPDEADVDDLI